MSGRSEHAVIAPSQVISLPKQTALRRQNWLKRNHLVEDAIEKAYAGDFAPFHALTERLTRPFEFTPEDADFALPPRPDQVVRATFCGT